MNVHLKSCSLISRLTFVSTLNPRDEKSTLLSQISSLQAQQAALENRLDSIHQTADKAMEREREAEDRLDAALSMHARQLAQRQV